MAHPNEAICSSETLQSGLDRGLYADMNQSFQDQMPPNGDADERRLAVRSIGLVGR